MSADLSMDAADRDVVPKLDLVDRPVLVRGPEDVDGTRPAPLAAGLRGSSVTSGPLFERAEHFLYEIYLASGFCEPSPRQVVEELDAWRTASTFHVVHDRIGEVLGSVRTIHGGWGTLPVGGFERLVDSHPDPLVELSSLAVRPSRRSSGVVEHIYRAGWLAALRAGANALVALVDPWLLELFVDHYELPFEVVGRSHRHMGGDVVPVALPLDGAAYVDLARNRQGFWEWTLEACSDSEIERWQMPPVGG